jgi:hypothetical protein
VLRILERPQAPEAVLTLAERLRSAADMLDRGRPTRALKVAQLACKEIGVAIAVGRIRDWAESMDDK